MSTSCTPGWLLSKPSRVFAIMASSSDGRSCVATSRKDSAGGAEKPSKAPETPDDLPVRVVVPRAADGPTEAEKINEIEALRAITYLLSGLDREAQGRIITWLTAKHSVGV